MKLREIKVELVKKKFQLSIKKNILFQHQNLRQVKMYLSLFLFSCLFPLLFL